MVRSGDWKLIRRLETDESLLLNTATDIGETSDQSETKPEISKRLNQSALNWLDAMKAPRMTPNPEYDPTVKR